MLDTVRLLVASLIVIIAPVRVRADEPPAPPAATAAPTPAAATAAPAPTAAPAAPPAAVTAATPASPSRWSLGGGIVFSVGTLTTSPDPTTLGVAQPSATGTLERRLSPRSWVYLDVQGSVQRNRSDVPASSYGVARSDARSLAATVGLRRVLTRPGAAVEVSALVGGTGGVLDGEERVVGWTGADSTQDRTLWFVGARAGLAVQRELTDGLALRVSTSLLSATYTRGSTRQATQPTRTSTGVSVDVAVRPQLELVAFF